MPAANKPEPELMEKMIERITRNVRWKYIFRNEPDADQNYITGMYINSKRDPDEASDEIERCLAKFKDKLIRERRKYVAKTTPP